MRNKKLPESELQIMLILWRSKEALHTGEILTMLGGGCKLQTVQNLMARLLEKGFVSCERRGKYNYYTPRVEEMDYRARETSTLLERFYGNSPGGLIATLVREHGLSPEELSDLRALLRKEDGENA